MMMSLRNKNKKKGFRNSMAGPIPKKIVFTDLAHDSQTIVTPAHDGYSSAATFELASAVVAPRLVLPSEKMKKGLLPLRMFVTSVNVEEVTWGAEHRRKGRQKREVYSELLASEVWSDGQWEANCEQMDEVAFAKIEREWEGFGRVEDIKELVEGILVGWKVLSVVVVRPQFVDYL
jgi:hypothetical protein